LARRRHRFLTKIHVPGSQLKASAWVALAAIVYGIAAMVTGYAYVPGKRGNGLMLNGFSAIMMAAAVFCLVANLVALIFSHGASKDEEGSYRDFRFGAAAVGWLLYALAILSNAGNRH